MIAALQINDLRIVEQMSLRPGPGINVISGPNGAGKTTILEAIYLAGRGRSFRHAEAGPMIRHGASHALVVVDLVDRRTGASSRLGVMRDKNTLTCRLDGEDVRRRSVLAEALPVQWIGSQPQLLLSLGPEIRRRFLDMGLFHVEHGYLENLAELQRCLRQRNAAIRTGRITEVRVWSRPLGLAGEKIAEKRRRFIDVIRPRVEAFLDAWQCDFHVEFRYRQGWSQRRTFHELLEERAESDIHLGYTSSGPQRADLELLTGGIVAEKILSRGQQKLLVLALHLTLLDLIGDARDGNAPVMLIDDLAAELDRTNRQRILEALERRGVQTFVTQIEPAGLPDQVPAAHMFHVEHGKLK